MLKFLVFDSGRPARQISLHGAYLSGADEVGLHGQIQFRDGMILCEKSSVGAAALALQFTVSEIGQVILQTCLLPDREEPYLLSLELARHRLMKMIAKQEDWSLFSLDDQHPVSLRLKISKQRFVDALNAIDNPVESDRCARESLKFAIDASEELALAHTDVMRDRQKRSPNRMRHKFGCGVALNQDLETSASILLENFDYVRLPTPWRQLEPEEGDYNWDGLDAWCTLAFLNHMPIIAGSVVSFSPESIPDWLYVWEHDYDTVRDLLYEHVERVVKRYRNVVSLWNVVSGLYANKHFVLNIEQAMDLTRMAVVLTKQIQPNAKTLVEITQPFGEYHAHNPQTIPPLAYAEMAIQSGIPFDGFGLKLVMGQAHDGQLTRDLMQLSSMLDRFGTLGKPVHVTAVAVPSVQPDAAREVIPPSVGDEEQLSGGYWRKPWSGPVQGRWLEAFYNIAFSKRVVESVAWLDLIDHSDSELPSAGLMRSDMQPKPSFQRLTAIRKRYQDLENNPPGGLSLSP